MKTINSNTNTQNISQAEFFDNPDWMFDNKAILNPPFHNIIETNCIVNALADWLQEKSESDINYVPTIVDFGAGSGRLSVQIAKFLNGTHKLNNKSKVKIGKTIFGAVEISPKSVKILKQNLKLVSEKPISIKSDFGDFENIGVIVGADILHHVDLTKYIPIMKQKLSSNGLVIFSEPNTLNIFWYIVLLVKSIVAKTNPVKTFQIESGIRFTNYFYLNKILTKVGFHDIRIEPLGLLPLSIFNKFPTLFKLNLFIARLPLLRWFAYRLIVSARG